MADSILRLRVDSQEYDNKLKRAAEGIQRYAENCKKAGGTLEYLDEGVLEFTRALGGMETTARGASARLSELKKTFTDMSVQYNKLTDAEKASPFGQALKGSLDELKGRIQEGNTEIKNINDSLNGSGGLGGTLDSIASKFGININQLTKFGSVLGATSAALKVAKDAFFTSETNVDDWGRTVASAESVYDSFLQTLNTGDFSGFLSRIGEVINKAKEAYDALDELGTRMTIINPERTRLQARVTELKAVIRRQGADSKAGIAAQNELKQIEGMLTQAFKTESKLNMDAFKAQVDKKLQEAGIKLGKKDYDFLMRTFSSDASYTAMRRGAKGGIQMTYEAGGSYDEGSVSKVDTRNMNQRLLDLFTDEWRREYSPLLNAAFSARGGAASAMLGDARYLKEGGSGGGGGRTGKIGPTDEELEARLEASIASAWDKAMTKAMSKSDTFKAIEPEGPSEAWKAYTDSIKQGSEEAEDSLKSLTDAFEALNNAQGVSPTKEIGKDADTSAKSFRNAASAISSMGNAMSQIEDPAAKIAGMIAESVASIALGFSQAIGKDAGSKGSVWYAIAAAAAGVASMITTISAIHSATGYAEGGIVQGNSYSGDNLRGSDFGINAGELVLNKAQQSTLASQLQDGGGLRNIKVSGRIKGTDIILSVDRSLQLQGKQLLTWG